MTGTPPPPNGDPPPPFDPELAAVVTAVNAVVPPALSLEALLALRRPDPDLAPISDDDLRRGGTYTVEELSVAGPPGAPDVPLLLCRPTAATAPTGVLYYLHGGGMVMGDHRMGVLDVLDLAHEVSCAVVSVGYRLAPETPHPGPMEDCYAGLVWTAQHAEEIGVDPDRVIVTGISAGGGLAAALALAARDRGGPALAGQLLVSPMLDDRNDSRSAVQMTGLGNWDRTSNETGWTALLGPRPAGTDVSPYAAPARARDLASLPPTYIDVGSAETFRDEDIAYAGRIWQAGGVAELHVWPGGFHGFDTIAPGARLSQDARAARGRWLRRLLDPITALPTPSSPPGNQ